jgi:peptidoglycan/LPS O-acetylase OafA/YrhL
MASLVDEGRAGPAVSTTATTAEGQPRESGPELYVGALDGLRGIAVAAVVIYHFAPSVLPAGFLGVDVFFVVSGFLIGRLVTREIRRSGSVSLRTFWVRRVRRLLPALATVTVVVLSVAAVKSSSDEMHNLRAQALGALFYCGNWVLIFTKSNYFTSLGRPSPFLHLWTLAVEEQFYIALPLALFAARRLVIRRPAVVAGTALVGAVASTMWMGVLVVPTADPSRAYLGSDSHAMGLLVGVALGVLAGSERSFSTWTRVTERSARPASRLAAVSLLAILVIMRVADDRTLALYRGGFLVIAALCGVVIAVVVTRPAALISRWLRNPVLVAVGLRSYSLYLWHWPVRVFVTSSSGFDGVSLFVVRLLLSMMLAEVSYRLIERPFRVGAVARRVGSRGAGAYFALLAVVAIALVVTVDAPKPLPPASLADLPAMPAPVKPKAASFTSHPTTLRVDIFGDSTGFALGVGGAFHAGELDISVGGDARVGCAVTPTDQVSDGWVITPPKSCDGWRARWQATMRNDPHARLALMSGAWELLDQETPTGVARFGTREWTDLNTSSLRAALDVLTADGRTVSLFEVPCYGTGDSTDSFPARSDPLRIAALNQIYADVAHSMPRVQIVRWRSLVCPGGHRVESVNGVRLWKIDDQHLTGDGAVVIWKWWLPQLRAAH